MFTIFLIIVLQLIGESIVQVSGLPVPGAIIGLVLLVSVTATIAITGLVVTWLSPSGIQAVEQSARP